MAFYLPIIFRMKFHTALLFLMLFSSVSHASPCKSWFYSNHSGKGVIRVRALHGKLDSIKLQSAAQSVNPAEWNGLAARLQKKLGPNYKVTLLTQAEFERSGHDCR